MFWAHFKKFLQVLLATDSDNVAANENIQEDLDVERTHKTQKGLNKDPMNSKKTPKRLKKDSII